MGATINFILLNVKSDRINTLYNFAREPYIYDLIYFLRKMGSNIILNKEYIRIVGVSELRSTNYEIMYDPIIMGTYILLGGLLDYKYSIKLHIYPIKKDILGEFYLLLDDLGISICKTDNKYCYIKYRKNICSKIETGYFPKLFTDIQPILTIFCAETF